MSWIDPWSLSACGCLQRIARYAAAVLFFDPILDLSAPIVLWKTYSGPCKAENLIARLAPAEQKTCFSSGLLQKRLADGMFHTCRAKPLVVFDCQRSILAALSFEGVVSLLMCRPLGLVLAIRIKILVLVVFGQTWRWRCKGVYLFLKALMWKRSRAVYFISCNGSAMVTFVLYFT